MVVRHLLNLFFHTLKVAFYNKSKNCLKVTYFSPQQWTFFVEDPHVLFLHREMNITYKCVGKICL